MISEKVILLAKAMRPKHYLKNGLIFLPAVFGGNLLHMATLRILLFSFVAFSLAASSIYIFNDLNDRQLDSKHPKKKIRPIASGAISMWQSRVLMISLLLAAILLQAWSGSIVLSIYLLVGYVLINACYSLGLKNIPIIDVAILSLGFVIRVYFGAVSVNIGVSTWLYLSILAFSFYLSLGKRRNEIAAVGSTTRKVNSHYTQDFLDKNMYVCLALTLVYYSLWTIDPVQSHKSLKLTVPLVLLITMTYSLTIEKSRADGDPVEVLTNNKLLLSMVVVYVAMVIGLIYF